MALEIVAEQVPDQRQFLWQTRPGISVGMWWQYQTITNIPADAVGWLVAQGWQISEISYIQNGQPPEPRYSMTREGFNNALIMQDMMNEFMVAYNDANYNNSARYNDVVTDWSDLIGSNHDYLTEQSELYDAWNTAYAAALDTYMDDVELVITDYKAALGIAETSAIAAAEDLNGRLTDLELNYNTHADLARGFLTDLGTTELARINEQFAASLSTELQGLTDRGLYSSTRAGDATARNTRDKNEAIAELNDRLNREKLTNQHTLYGQLQDALQGYMAGKAQYAALTTQTMGAVGSQRHTVFGEKMGTYSARLDAVMQSYDKGLQLMQYMLEERNNLHIGLFGFVERREDVAPSISDLAQISVSLGDSGGGWMTP